MNAIALTSRFSKRIKKEITRHPVYQKTLQKKVALNHRKCLFQLQKKKKINVAFLLINLSQWKYEKLYFLLKNDKRFNPVVFICPFTLYTEEIRKQEQENAYRYLSKRGYKTVQAVNGNGKLLNIKKEFRPDLVFFTSPWIHTHKPYLIHNFLDTLTAYVPYFYNSSSWTEKSYNQPIHNLAWKVFVESEFHQKLAENSASNKGKNVVVTGYPGLDPLIDPQRPLNDPWKPQPNPKKRIIWAPHHTLPGHQETEFSNFFEYADLMMEIAEKYRDHIQIAFKPHPNLRGKLYQDTNWGKKRTDDYFEKWSTLPNGQLEESEYVDLFLTSDAMIHDSRSFIFEYLTTQKPVLFLIRNEKVKEDTNKIGLNAFEKMYLGRHKKDIFHFIEAIILHKKDAMQEARTTFFNTYLKPPHNQSASQNIYEYLKIQFQK